VYLLARPPPSDNCAKAEGHSTETQRDGLLPRHANWRAGPSSFAAGARLEGRMMLRVWTTSKRRQIQVYVTVPWTKSIHVPNPRLIDALLRGELDQDDAELVLDLISPDRIEKHIVETVAASKARG
jgi:hypothetical protein